MTMRLLLVLWLLNPILFLSAQSPLGTWKTIDDSTGEPKSHVEIFQKDGHLFGKVIALLQAEKDALCTECSGSNANQPILGMIIMKGMKPTGNIWEKGNILDPESGNTYKCKIWLDPDDNSKLKVRGIHWTGLYRTQIWERI